MTGPEHLAEADKAFAAAAEHTSGSPEYASLIAAAQAHATAALALAVAARSQDDAQLWASYLGH